MAGRLFLFLLLGIASFSFACGGRQAASTASPTESYKRLYAAVKAKDTAAIKGLLTKRTVGMEDAAAKRAGKSLEDMLAAGGTETTYAETLPTIRDERIKDNMAAIEVWRETCIGGWAPRGPWRCHVCGSHNCDPRCPCQLVSACSSGSASSTAQFGGHRSRVPTIA